MSEFDEKMTISELLQKVTDTPYEESFPVGNANPVMPMPMLADDDILDVGDGFDFEKFQVVRREFFAHIFEPSVTFNNCKFNVNTACLNKFPKADYVQVLINQKSKMLALRPCEENARDSFQWCNAKAGKRKPKQVTCKLFFAKIFSLMDWNPDYRYKLLGRLIHANGEYLLAFDMTATEVYQRIFPEGQKPRASRTPVFPAEWQDQFGLPFSEHRQSMQINIFDGYAIYAIKEKTQNMKSDVGATSQESFTDLTAPPLENPSYQGGNI